MIKPVTISMPLEYLILLTLFITTSIPIAMPLRYTHYFLKKVYNIKVLPQMLQYNSQTGGTVAVKRRR